MASRRKSILLLEDSELIRAAATARLEAEGYAVTGVESITQLEMTTDPRVFDLILLDVEVAELFGDDVGMVLRKVRGVNVPIWLYSSRPADELAERVRDAGVDGFISKTEGLDVLVERVAQILPDDDDKKEQS
ncbi:MAG TPA: response regulator [Kofleriaceae bacterium]|nr:response regulator [Kofleriaceae bacterium]